ncbi:uncharacterized protein LOC111369052 [Olea europaea var. sylvestris]|uniref:uncharacterized protein LOC111369052 n=1 Tax=Olea europaea var. sylvestris TaxID=158386 RepID=UPI000C1D4B2E|nr:uncharacterized protein LOC111369052 [Olea europaea var. sylvestris]
MAIFADMVEDIMEVFMDDFSMFGTSFDDCLYNLLLVLQCSRGLEVGKVKIDTVAKLPPPTNVQGIRSFLGHAGFYRRFIKDFSKVPKPICDLLEKDTTFVFDAGYLRAFETIKEKLVTAPVMVVPDWNQSFEVMCDASDYVVKGSRKKA